MGFLKFQDNGLKNVSDLRINTNAILFSHFLGGLEPFVRVNNGTSAGAETWAGSGNSTIASPSSQFPGICRLTTGTTSTGRVFIGSHVSAFLFGGGICECETMLRIETLSTDSENYSLRIGFLDNATGESADGIFLRYTHNVNQGNWQLVARVNGVEVFKDLTIPATINFTKIHIKANASGTLAEVFIDDNFIENIVPPASFVIGRQCGYGVLILKSAGSLARNILIDYMYLAINQGG